VATKPAEAAFPGANGKIAFESNRPAPGNPVPPGQPRPDSEIFAMRPDGTGIEQLTSNRVQDYYPAWSADGRWMAYASYTTVENSEIYMRSYRAGDFDQTLQLTNHPEQDLDPTFSPDGSKIAFVRVHTQNFEIYVMDTADTDGDGNGDNLTRFTNNTVDDFSPAWSPDGTKIAFVSIGPGGQQDIFVMGSAIDVIDPTPPPVNLTNNPASDSEPNWSPDGSQIAFVSTRDNNHNIYVMNANGSGQTRLTRNAAPDFSPAWSPDGTRIVFQSNREGGPGTDLDVFVMRAMPESATNRPRSLTRNNVVENHPDWRPIP
jgi:Tol biopolymer transport system component